MSRMMFEQIDGFGGAEIYRRLCLTSCGAMDRENIVTFSGGWEGGGRRINCLEGIFARVRTSDSKR